MKTTKLDLQRIIKELNAPRGRGKQIGLKSALHEGQVEAMKYLYDDSGVQTLFIACGRKFGKTEMALYSLWRQALLVPGSACYYVVPDIKHAKKILWDTQRVQRYMPTKYRDGPPRQRDLMVKLTNGSFIQLIGAENYESANGLSPHFLVYDEFKAFHPNFHRTMGPNRVTHGAKLLIIGTMADRQAINQEEYWSMFKYCKTSKKAHIHIATTFDNPINSKSPQKEALQAEMEILRNRGDEDVVQREFYSKIIPASNKAIIPTFKRETHVLPHGEILNAMRGDLGDIQWYSILDPGTTSVFGGLFVGINPYTKRIYVLDELYETRQKDTSCTVLLPKVKGTMKDLAPVVNFEDWRGVCDNAGAWAINEIQALQEKEEDHNIVTYFPTEKHLNKQEVGINLMKDIFLHNLCLISDRCENFIKELEEYALDDKGRIPKKNDHCIDCFRYFLGADNYSLLEAFKVVEKDDTPEMYKGRFLAPAWDNELGDHTFSMYDEPYDFEWE